MGQINIILIFTICMGIIYTMTLTINNKKKSNNVLIEKTYIKSKIIFNDSIKYYLNNKNAAKYNYYQSIKSNLINTKINPIVVFNIKDDTNLLDSVVIIYHNISSKNFTQLINQNYENYNFFIPTKQKLINKNIDHETLINNLQINNKNIEKWLGIEFVIGEISNGFLIKNFGTINQCKLHDINYC